MRLAILSTFLLLGLALAAASAVGNAVTGRPDEACIECHSDVTPRVVSDFLSGAMGAAGVQNPRVAEMTGLERVYCTTCHGSRHTTGEDWRGAVLPNYQTCEGCHGDQVAEFLAGKHSLAWKAMMAIPVLEKTPREEVLFGCGGCHRIGVKDASELLELGLSRPYGVGASCDQCHTRHAFSAYEARQPEACSKCHMGFDHPQWEMWSKSKHGNMYFARKGEYPLDRSLKDVSPSEYPGPTCQLCHMPEGSHEVVTPWGFIGLVAFEGRPEGLQLVDDPEWEAAKVELLKALRVLTPEGEPTPLLGAVLDLRIVRASPDEFFEIREEIVATCSACHAENFVMEYLTLGDRVIRETTIQLAEAIKAIAKAREQGVLPPRLGEAENPYPFLLLFHEEPTSADREAYMIFMEYRMRAFQGMFHVNPDYTFWYGWAEVRRAVEDLKEGLEELRAVSGIELSLDTIELDLGTIEERFESVERTLGDLEAALDSIKQAVAGLASRTDALAVFSVTALVAAVIAVAIYFKRMK